MTDFNITELLPLLKSERTDVRLQALQIAAHIVDASNVATLCSGDVFESISSSLDQLDLRLNAATLIINIIAEQGEIREQAKLLEKIVDFLQKADFPRNEVNVFLILLSNLTISEDLCEHLITHCAKKDTLQVLIDRFLAYNPQTVETDEVLDDYSDSDVWQHFSSVLCNLCRLETGRRLILSVSTGNMSRCLKQFRSKNPVRRRGVVGCVRSCLFNADVHWWMVNEMNVIPALLLPLVTETEFTEAEKEGMDPILWMQGPNKQPDPEKDIQKMLLESLQMLGMTRAMREEMRKRKVYPICRNLDYLQDDEDISNIIYEIVQLTMGYEDPNTPLENKVCIEDSKSEDLKSEEVSRQEDVTELNEDVTELDEDACGLDGVD